MTDAERHARCPRHGERGHATQRCASPAACARAAFDLLDPSRAILALRERHGQDVARCPTCGGDGSRPTRRVVGGKVVGGCVDPCHTEPLRRASQLSQDWFWHMAPSHVELRWAEYRRMQR